MSDPLRSTIGKALGRVPSGVFILTARHDGKAAAMLVSWVQQAGFHPPAVCAAVARDRPARAMIEASGRFALSVLGQYDSPLMKKYARGIPPDAEPFEGISVRDAESGTPVLADALAYLDCRLMQVCDFGGDHDLLIGEITAGQQLKDGQPFTHVRGNGFHY